MTDLKELEEDFKEIHNNERLSALESYYFYETKPLTMGVSQQTCFSLLNVLISAQ